MNSRAKQRQARGWVEDEVLEKPPGRPTEPLLETPRAGLRQLPVPPEHEGARIDKFLAAMARQDGEALSRTRIQALIEAGAVEVDGERAKDAGLKVRAGQTVAIDVPEAAPAEPQAEAIPLKVVFEDAHLIVIDKPAGLVVHPAAGHESGTLVNALIAHCGASLSGIGGVKRPGIVHRIDKDTSGLLVVAKTDAAHQALSELFADHGRTLHLVREYLALVWGAPSRARGAVDAPIGRHAHNRERQAVVHGERGREAITHWQVEETFNGKEGGPVAALVRCALETGRTHQIRVHMAHIGHPVMGDPLYATGFKTKTVRLSAKAKAAHDTLGRQALHAAVLGFTHPVTGADLHFESEMPKDMLKLAKALRG